MFTPPPTGARLLADRYRLERPLARGAMGELWVGRDRTLDRPVAVKLISTALGDSELMRVRFQREARAAARLRSPHVVPVFDHGEDEGISFIVMELLEGEGLDARLRRIGTCSLAEAVWLTEQVTRGLTVAHDAGVVHRDLKPANLFVAKSADEEIVKILDFGIAKLAGFDGTTTMTGELVGSPFYMSPEQAEGTVEIDHKSDLWAVGVILYLALTGRIVFEAPSLALALDRIRSAPVPPPSSFVNLPPAIDAFFERALARDRAARFDSARQLAQAFVAAAGVAPQPLARDRVSEAPHTAARDRPTVRERLPSDPATHVLSREAITAPFPVEEPPDGGRTHRGVARPVDEVVALPLAELSGRRRRHSRHRVVAATVAVTALVAGLVGVLAFRFAPAQPGPAAEGPASAAPAIAEPVDPADERAEEDLDPPEPARGEGVATTKEAAKDDPPKDDPPKDDPPKERATRPPKAQRPKGVPGQAPPRPAPPPPSGGEGSPKRLELGY